MRVKRQTLEGRNSTVMLCALAISPVPDIFAIPILRHFAVVLQPVSCNLFREHLLRCWGILVGFFPFWLYSVTD